MRGDVVRLEQLTHEIILAADYEGFSLPEKILWAYVYSWRQEKIKQVWDEVRRRLGEAVEPALGERALTDFLFAVTGEADPKNFAVLQHFIWQVKRKAFGLPVGHHMVPVFIGKTGGGKSIAVEHFLSPLEPLWTVGTLEICGDKREHALFEDYLVVNMDEMEKADKADLQALKRVISSSTLNQRIMKTNLHDHIRMRATLIGSSNESLDQIIKDPTSNRRFYPIQCLPREKAEPHFEFVKKGITYLHAYQAIDPLKDTPARPLLDEIRAVQEESRYKTDVEQWFADGWIGPDPDGFASNKEICQSYTKWCIETGVSEKYRRSMDGIGRILSSIDGFKRTMRRKERGYTATIFK